MKSRNARIAAALGLGLAGMGAVLAAGAAPTEWKDWGGDAARTHYSSLAQITAANVARLKPVWVWDSGVLGRSWEITPLLVDGTLIVSEPISADVVALEPETGRPLWRYRAPASGRGLERRGFAWWGGDGAMKPRIVAIFGHVMVGIDPATGQASSDWPAAGFDIGLPNPTNGGAIGGGVFAGSPPIIYKNLIITAGASGFQPPPAQPADPHANDLRTGKLVWVARLIPGANEPGGNSWGPGSQNVVGSGAWGILSLDEKTGTVYVPTDSGNPDYAGVWRPGDNKWADSTVALDAETGKFKWGFQNHHHDIYDLDTMAPPVPVEITRNGKKTKVIVQTTKQGMIWILDAQTGQPVLPFEERAVTQSRIPGEVSSPTQPFTVSPPPLSDAIVHRDRLSQLSDRANAECTALFDANKLTDAGPFNPPRPDGAWSIMSVGATGGIDWGGASIDRDHGTAIANVTNLPTMITVSSGTGGVAGNNGLRSTSGNVRFMDNDGRSCNGGRQGELVSVDLATGRIRWRVALGSLEDEYGARAHDMGATNIGPSLVTHGGLVFIGAATDDRFHAYDSATGRLLWQMKMPASANAGPMTYLGKDGRQYVVIAAGGPGNARRPSQRESKLYRQTLIAFALPRPGEKVVDIATAYPPHLLGPGESLQSLGGAGNAILATGAAPAGRGGRGRGAQP